MTGSPTDDVELMARFGITKVPTHITINQDNRSQTIALPSAQDMDTYLKRITDAEALPVSGEHPSDAEVR